MTFMNPTRRDDIVLETDELLDASGNYTSPWLETAGIGMVRVATTFNPPSGTAYVSIEDGIFTTLQGDPKTVRTQWVDLTEGRLGYAEIPITGRYFRLVVSNGPAEELLRAIVRKV